MTTYFVVFGGILFFAALLLGMDYLASRHDQPRSTKRA